MTDDLFIIKEEKNSKEENKKTLEEIISHIKLAPREGRLFISTVLETLINNPEAIDEMLIELSKDKSRDAQKQYLITIIENFKYAPEETLSALEAYMEEPFNFLYLSPRESRAHLNSLDVSLKALKNLLLKKEFPEYIIEYVQKVINTIGWLYYIRDRDTKFGVERFEELAIDPTDSGFPNLEVLRSLKVLKRNISQFLNKLPEKEEIMRDAKKKLFKGEMPKQEQENFVQRRYYEELAEADILDKREFKIIPITEIKSENYHKKEQILVPTDTCELNASAELAPEKAKVNGPMILEQEKKQYKKKNWGLLGKLFGKNGKEKKEPKEVGCYELHFAAMDITKNLYVYYVIECVMDKKNELKSDSTFVKDFFDDIFGWNPREVFLQLLSRKEIEPKRVTRYLIGPFFCNHTENSKYLSQLFEGRDHPYCLVFKKEWANSISLESDFKSENQLKETLCSPEKKEGYCLVPYELKRKLEDIFLLNKDNNYSIIGITEKGDLIEH